MKTIYNIENTVNLDTNPCFNSENTYPDFQEDLSKFKTHLCTSVRHGESETFYKFGDGDYYFLTKQEVGSAKPGNRAISVSYDDINLHIQSQALPVPYLPGWIGIDYQFFPSLSKADSTGYP